MIGEPLNDGACLAGVSDIARGLAEEEGGKVQAIAARFATTLKLAKWIRSLPQRDDTGDPEDGPKVPTCLPPQRLRIPADDPNCVERAALYVAAAELIDPEPLRQLVTVDTTFGKHTFPVEDGAPVVLDPRVRRNALEGALFQLEGGAVRMTADDAVRWVSALAAEPAAGTRNGLSRVARGKRAMRQVLKGRPLDRRARNDLGWTLELAGREAKHFGDRGRTVLGTTARAIERLDARRRPRNASVGIGRYRARADLGTLGAIARVGGRLGLRVGAAAAQAKLAEFGITEPLLGEVEGELNREGLSLGALARPAPMPGTLESATTDALAGRWLASRIL